MMKYQIEVGLITKETFEESQKEALAKLNEHPGDKYEMKFCMLPKGDWNSTINTKK